MQPLQKIQRLLTWLRMYPSDKPLCVWQTMARSLFALFILVTNLCCLASCLAYNFKYFSIDINGSIHALTTVVAEVCLVYVMIMAILMRRKIARNFEQLSKIYADCKYEQIESKLWIDFPIDTFQNVIVSKNLDETESSFCFLLEANGVSEWMLTIYWEYMKITNESVAVAPIISGYYCWTKGSFNVKCFFHHTKFMWVSIHPILRSQI